jgi:hypothetical protein
MNYIFESRVIKNFRVFSDRCNFFISGLPLLTRVVASIAKDFSYQLPFLPPHTVKFPSGSSERILRALTSDYVAEHRSNHGQFACRLPVAKLHIPSAEEQNIHSGNMTSESLTSVFALVRGCSFVSFKTHSSEAGLAAILHACAMIEKDARLLANDIVDRC